MTCSGFKKEHLIGLEDAAVVIRNKEGKVKVNQEVDMVGAGALGGAFWGLLIVIKEVGSTIQPGNSALFLLVRESTPDKVISLVAVNLYHTFISLNVELQMGKVGIDHLFLLPASLSTLPIPPVFKNSLKSI